MLTAGIRAIADEVVAFGGEACDLVVLSDPTRATLTRAFEQLEPGGTCWVEWNRTRVFASRPLQRAGFSIVERFAVWRRQFWLPLSSPKGVVAFVNQRPLPRSRAARVFARATRSAWRVGWQTGLHPRVSVLASKGARPIEASRIMCTPGRSELNKVILFEIPEDDGEPQLVIKFPRTAEAEAGLKREAAALRAIALRPVAAVAHIPRCIFCEPQASSLALGETVIWGKPVIDLLGRNEYRPLAVRVADMLAELADGAVCVSTDEWWPRLGAPVVRDFRKKYCRRTDAAVLDRIVEQLRALPPLPIIPEQRDCSPWNVLTEKSGRLAILDWESAEPNGLPGLDLMYFLAHAAFASDRLIGSGREPEAYRKLIARAEPYGPTFFEIVDRYAAAVSVDAAALHALRPFMWMLHAVGEYDRGGSLFVQLWRADIDHARFE
jgi:hypothetical protein